jgi:hypothetical protein
MTRFIQQGSAGSALILLLLTGCGERTETEIARVVSPNKKAVATALQVDPGGGATVGFTIEVYVAETSKPDHRDLQFKGYSCGPVSIAWEDDRILKVSYWPHCHILSFDNAWYPRSEPVSTDRVELVLERKDHPDNPWVHPAGQRDRSP